MIGVNISETGLARALAPFLKPGVQVSLRTPPDEGYGSYEVVVLTLGEEVLEITADGDTAASYFTVGDVRDPACI